MCQEVRKNTEVFDTLQAAIDRVPIHFLGQQEKAKLSIAFKTSNDGIYQVFLSYGNYSLQGELHMFTYPMLYLDYNSYIVVFQAMLSRGSTKCTY